MSFPYAVDKPGPDSGVKPSAGGGIVGFDPHKPTEIHFIDTSDPKMIRTAKIDVRKVGAKGIGSVTDGGKLIKNQETFEEGHSVAFDAMQRLEHLAKAGMHIRGVPQRKQLAPEPVPQEPEDNPEEQLEAAAQEYRDVESEQEQEQLQQRAATLRAKLVSGTPPAPLRLQRPAQGAFRRPQPAPAQAAKVAVAGVPTPERQVLFEIEGAGPMEAWYHDVVRHDNLLLLAFDKRFRGPKWMPPNLLDEKCESCGHTWTTDAQSREVDLTCEHCGGACPAPRPARRRALFVDVVDMGEVFRTESLGFVIQFQNYDLCLLPIVQAVKKEGTDEQSGYSEG